MDLRGPFVPPRAGGAPRRLVVLLHGVGADGDDLIALAPFLAEALPDAAFVAPDAPERYDMAPFGRQWFSLQDRGPGRMLAGVQASAPALDAFLDAELARHGLKGPDLAVLGFSQGAMMALHIAPRRPHAMAGVVAFSGRMIAPERLPAEVVSRPPVLLIHGDADDVVPPQSLPAAVTALQAAEIPVQWQLRPGLGHGIDPEGLQAAAEFLQAVFTEG